MCKCVQRSSDRNDWCGLPQNSTFICQCNLFAYPKYKHMHFPVCCQPLEMILMRNSNGRYLPTVDVWPVNAHLIRGQAVSKSKPTGRASVSCARYTSHWDGKLPWPDYKYSMSYVCRGVNKHSHHNASFIPKFLADDQWSHKDVQWQGLVLVQFKAHRCHSCCRINEVISDFITAGKV